MDSNFILLMLSTLGMATAAYIARMLIGKYTTGSLGTLTYFLLTLINLFLAFSLFFQAGYFSIKTADMYGHWFVEMINEVFP